MRFVTKEYEFAAAHRLVNGYVGNCAHIHGHTWKVRTTLALNELQGHVLNKFGFVKDYHDFKPLKWWIDSNLDHASLVSREDTSWLKLLRKEKQRHFVVNGNPTSEMIAQILFNYASSVVFASDPRVTVDKVELFESPTSCTTITGSTQLEIDLSPQALRRVVKRTKNER
jgi:6-pyruvoyl-tetrahydropterin synthase